MQKISILDIWQGSQYTSASYKYVDSHKIRTFGQPKKNCFFFQSAAGWIFFKMSRPLLEQFFSCLSSYNVMLNMILTLFIFYSIVFNFYLNQATCIDFFYFLQICYCNILHVNIGCIRSFIRRFDFILHDVNGCAYTSKVDTEDCSVSSKISIWNWLQSG